MNKIENELKLKIEESEELKYDINAKSNLIETYENDFKRMRSNEVDKLTEYQRAIVEFENKLKDNLELINEKDTKLKQINQSYENIKSQFVDLQKERNDIEETSNSYKRMLNFLFCLIIE